MGVVDYAWFYLALLLPVLVSGQSGGPPQMSSEAMKKDEECKKLHQILMSDICTNPVTPEETECLNKCFSEDKERQAQLGIAMPEVSYQFSCIYTISLIIFCHSLVT